MIEKVSVRLVPTGEFMLEGEIKCSDLNPKATLLLSAAKCSGLTTMRIMEKERVRPKRFEISVSGALSTETLQSGSIFTSFNMIYNLECDCIEDQIKISRAVNLAHDKYCGLVRMLRMIAPVAHEIAIVNTARPVETQP